MRFDNTVTIQAIISSCSCPLFIGAVYKTWRINPSMCIVLFIYVALLICYIFYPWRYKKWGDTHFGKTAAEREPREMALRFKSTLKAVHLAFFILFLAVPIICSFLLLLQVNLPDYTNDLVAQSLAKQEYKEMLNTKAVSLLTVDPNSTTSNLSFVATIQSNKGIAYPTSPFVEILFRTLLNPLWNIALSALLIFIVFIIGAWFTELVGSSLHRFTKTT